MGDFVNVYTGPMVGETLVFVPVNAAVFFLSLLVIIRIGKGKLNLPIILLALGFLAAAATPVILGVKYLWVVPLVQTTFGALSIISLMKIFGIFGMIFGSDRPSLFSKKDKTESITGN